MVFDISKFVCPYCNGNLSLKSKNKVECLNCFKYYNLKNNILIFEKY